MKKYIIFIIILFLLPLVLGYGRLIGPRGIACSDCNNIFLNLSGTNANQDIDISPYNLTLANLFFPEGRSITYDDYSHTFTINEDTYISGWLDLSGTLFVNLIEFATDDVLRYVGANQQWEFDIGGWTEFSINETTIDARENNIITTGNVTANWFKGKFNWTTGDNWNDFDGSILTFNSSKLSARYYNGTSSTVVKGIIDGGSLVDTQHPDAQYDSVSINFSEEGGSPGLDLRINFTGIEDFSRGIMRYKTSSLSGDHPVRQLWNYNTNNWDTLASLSESEDFVIVTMPIFNKANYIQDGVVQLRLYKSSTGKINNHYYIDWVAMVGGYGVPSGQEVDPLSYHKNKNINASNYNVTADYYFGDGSQLINIAGGNLSWNQSFADTLYAKYQFTDNNFNGSGNFTTTGNIQSALLGLGTAPVAGKHITMNGDGILRATSDRIIFEANRDDSGNYEDLYFEANNGWWTIGSTTGQTLVSWDTSFKLSDDKFIAMGTASADSIRFGWKDANSKMEWQRGENPWNVLMSLDRDGNLILTGQISSGDTYIEDGTYGLNTDLPIQSFDGSSHQVLINDWAGQSCGVYVDDGSSHYTKIGTGTYSVEGDQALYSSDTIEADNGFISGGISGIYDTYNDGVDTQITFTGGIATAISTAFDERLMKEITYLGSNPEAELTPISFKWKEEGLAQFQDREKHKETITGYYKAQDVQKFYPNCMVNPKEIKEVNYLRYNRNCVYANVENDLRKKINELENRLENLEMGK